ncbi:MAG: hypothetical protein DCF20_09855 [Pseudanabaena sp.]|nr:MAG: hypothetical protein DCF20_09855 [Pseudanabaena sp.]
MLTRNSKLILCAMGLMLGLGSIVGYFLAKWDIQSNGFSSSTNAIAATASDSKPKQIDLKPAPIPPRSELELKYRTCTNSQINSKALARFDDKKLNDLVFKVCSENS